MKNIHLIIATGQAQANLIPLLQLNPDVVAFAVSDDMKSSAEGFKSLLSRLKPALIIEWFENVPSIGLAHIEQKAAEIYQALKTRYPDSIITYHATGGSKPMVLAFYHAFSQENNRIIYNHTEHKQIEILYPENTPFIPLDYLLNAKNYLRSLGFELKNSSDVNTNWTNPALTRQKLTCWLANNAPALNGFLGDMNTLVDAAMDSRKKKLVNPCQSLKNTPDDIAKTALEKLNDFNICQWSTNNQNQVIFNTVNHAKYISGAWLEEYVWLMANTLDMNEVRANVRFSPLTNSTIENEMDAIIVHNNRLLAIECKTANLERDTRSTNNMLYKLEALNKIGGLYHGEWLVSARPVSNETQDRANSSNIKIITPEQLSHLKSTLKDWRDAKNAK